MTQTFAQAAEAFYNTGESWARFGASDTEPRGEFAQIVQDLVDGKDPIIPTRAWSDRYDEPSWQLYSGMKGNGLAAAALTRAAKNAVEVGKVDHIGLVSYARAQGWY